jgi:protein-tyrosine phosphatase
LIDLHCHLLPGIDDGARELDVSLAMARMALADGITVTACTPHILPGVYNNTGPMIRERVALLREALAQAGIPLRIVAGADVHVAPDLTAQLRDGRALTINDSRYLLLEPPHHVLPPRMDDYIFGLQTVGYVPIITHPERLSWVDGHYDLIERLVYGGCLMQLTAGSLLGRFGRRPRHLADRMLEDGLCHLLATDAHNTEQRPPILSEARELVTQRLGAEEATNLVLRRPEAILHNANLGDLPPPVQARPRHRESSSARSSWGSFFRRGRKTGNAR